VAGEASKQNSSAVGRASEAREAGGPAKEANNGSEAMGSDERNAE